MNELALKCQSTLEEVRKEKDIKGERKIETRRWYNLKVMDIRIILAALGGVLIATGFLLNIDIRVIAILVALGAYLIYKGRYY